MEKSLYTFHRITPWKDEIIGIVARDLNHALYIALINSPHIKRDDLIDTVPVEEEVNTGVRFHIKIGNPEYEG